MLPFIGGLVAGALVGGIASVAMGGDFFRGALTGGLLGGVGGLIGSALAPAGASTTLATIGGNTVSIFGSQLTQEALYSLLGGTLGGFTGGMQEAQKTKAEKRLRAEQALYAQRENELRDMERRQSAEARKALANFNEGVEREIAHRGREMRSADDANTAFWRYLNEWGEDDRSLSEAVEEAYIQSAYA